MIYKPKRSPYINAFKFNKIEDIPEELKDFITPFNFPGISYDQRCPRCNKSWMEHISFNGNPICPGQYILYTRKNITSLMPIDKFESIYRPVAIEDAQEVK